jgi:beta-fructofuranosidase
MNKNRYLQDAEHYIEENRKNVNKRYRHTYHVMPPIGWMNDPNGFSFFGEQYHLFYQYYPYDTQWGPMFWGHVVSDDLLDWKTVPLALSPGECFDRHGVFSGTALEINEKLYLYYTGVYDENIEKEYDENLKKRKRPIEIEGNNTIKQVQCLAISEDGIHFQKKGEILGSNMIRQNGRVEDFRDPKVWTYKEKFYMVVGSKSVDYRAQVLFYVSDDGVHFDYLNYFSLGKEYGSVWECPDIFEMGGKHIMIISPQEKPKVEKAENIFATFALIGTFDYEKGQFSLERVQNLDFGFDFYAPQTIESKTGKRVLIAWMNMWGRDYALHRINHGWNGSMTIPRELELKDDCIIQYPSEALKTYRRDYYHSPIKYIDGSYIDEKMNGDTVDIELEFNMAESNFLYIDLLKAVNTSWECDEALTLSFDKESGEIKLDRSKSSLINVSENLENDYERLIHTNLKGDIKLRILLDVSSCEIFINDGEYVMTALFYKKEIESRFEIRSVGKTHIVALEKWKINQSLRYE